jgi:hypothetical protein
LLRNEAENVDFIDACQGRLYEQYFITTFLLLGIYRDYYRLYQRVVPFVVSARIFNQENKKLSKKADYEKNAKLFQHIFAFIVHFITQFCADIAYKIEQTHNKKEKLNFLDWRMYVD